jgi:hypothetical protein
MSFPARAIIAALCIVLLFSLTGRVSAKDSFKTSPRCDGEYITFPKDNTSITIALDPSGKTSVMRSGAGIYHIREDERVHLNDIDLDTPESGADIIVLDIDFDGRPEFLLKFDSSGTNQYYFLVDETGAPLCEKLFNDPNMEFSNPTFQTATRTITAWDRSGGLATYSLYKFRSGQYFLSEETEPIYEASRLMLERRIEHLTPEKTRSTVRYYGDMTNKPVKLRTISKTPLYAHADDEMPSGKYLNKGEVVIIIDAAVGECGHMLHVRGQQSRVSGWAPEEAFLVRTTQDTFLAAAPGSTDPVPNNLSGPYIPAYTELPMLTERKDRHGQIWLEVYFLEGDISGWVLGSETMPVPLPEMS